MSAPTRTIARSSTTCFTCCLNDLRYWHHSFHSYRIYSIKRRRWKQNYQQTPPSNKRRTSSEEYGVYSRKIGKKLGITWQFTPSRHLRFYLSQVQTMPTFTQMSAVSISTSFHLHHLWDDRIREDILGSVSITTIFTSHSTSTRRDCLVLFTMAACLSGNAEHHTSNRICQRHSPQL